MREKKIFIACPITRYLLPKGGIAPEFEAFIKEVLSLCRSYTSNVFLALEREKYGFSTMEDHVCTPLDYREMVEADYVIAIPEDSMGVAVEIGWASSMRKQMLIIKDNVNRYSPLINAIGTVTDAKVVTFNIDQGYVGVKDEIIRTIREYLDSKFLALVES